VPKNKKPAGGRPARNFDPSYAKGGRKGGTAARNGSTSQKAGSRSPGHRGYRQPLCGAYRSVPFGAKGQGK